MPWAPLLSESEIASGLEHLPEWTREGDAITRTVRSPSFGEAIELVVRIADVAESADHHPDMLIRWRRVTFTLSTHASGGLTAKDLVMAAEIDRLAAAGESGTGRESVPGG
ncbi:MAG: 4a-hydroxytetrahydrobiopterin dehydratase [Chloroflexota bacterium]|nr:4a-hydroxytetrahydrobiopterin dehydratase [Chloroflexota bacterium]